MEELWPLLLPPLLQLLLVLLPLLLLVPLPLLLMHHFIGRSSSEPTFTCSGEDSSPCLCVTAPIGLPKLVALLVANPAVVTFKLLRCPLLAAPALLCSGTAPIAAAACGRAVLPTAARDAADRDTLRTSAPTTARSELSLMVSFPDSNPLPRDGRSSRLSLLVLCELLPGSGGARCPCRAVPTASCTAQRSVQCRTHKCV
jgi:hypothetical protein